MATKNQISTATLVRPDLPMMVHVTAPATLPEGYTFEAEINGDPNKLFTCEVPEGGVREGQVFLSPLSTMYDGPRINAPTGRWKDELCDCCSEGLCHPSLCCAIWCRIISMGQIMSRMQLTWLGGPGPLDRTRQTFSVILMLAVAIFLYSAAINTLALQYEPYTTEEMPTALHIASWIGMIFGIWYTVALCCTRKTMRERYQIPEHSCKGCEDCCCAYWCSCCVTAQMLRHTGEYEHYPGVCCSATGHPPGTPLVV